MLTGNTGANQLNGGAGNDTLIGGAGNDTYVVDAGDLVTELAGQGTDLVQSSVTWTLGSNVDNLTLTGVGNINGTGNADANVLTGNTGANQLNGGAGNDTLIGGAGNDTLTLSDGGADRVVLDSSVGFDLITSFATASDVIALSQSQSALYVGDKDTTVDGGVVVGAGGSFASSAELVIFTNNISGSLTTTSAAGLIKQASAAYTTGQHALFAVDNGTDSQLYYFTSSGTDAIVSASELTLLATLSGTGGTALSDYVFI